MSIGPGLVEHSWARQIGTKKLPQKAAPSQAELAFSAAEASRDFIGTAQISCSACDMTFEIEENEQKRYKKKDPSDAALAGTGTVGEAQLLSTQ